MPFFYIQWRKEKSNITFFKMKISKRLVISSFCFPFSLKQVKLETIQSVWRTGIHSSDHYCCLFEGKFFKNLLFRKKSPRLPASKDWEHSTCPRKAQLTHRQSQTESALQTGLLWRPPTCRSEGDDTSNLEMRVLLIKRMTSIFHSTFPWLTQF